MPRAKKQHLKRRKDGRFACRYKGEWFYGNTEEEAFALRDAYKEAEKQERPTIPTVREYGESWLKRAFPTVAASTLDGLQCHLKKLTDLLGDVPINTVKPSQIKSIYSASYLGLSNSYIKAGKQLFSSLFDSAVADGYLRTNLARDKTAKPHKGTYNGHRQITAQERQWIETLCTDHRAYPAVMAMLYAGLRPQEAKAIQIERDVDFEAETITVRETAHLDGRKYEYTEQGKTDKANRTIPLLPPLKDALKGRTGNLISSAHGERVTVDTWRVVWNSYVHQMETAINGMERRWYGRTREHKALLKEKKQLPEWIPFTVLPYDLRHSFCCMCRDAEPPIELHTCIRWMGHADATMILRVYDEASDDRSEKEAERLKQSLIRCQNGSQEKSETAETVEK